MLRGFHSLPVVPQKALRALLQNRPCFVFVMRPGFNWFVVSYRMVRSQCRLTSCLWDKRFVFIICQVGCCYRKRAVGITNRVALRQPCNHVTIFPSLQSVLFWAKSSTAEMQKVNVTLLHAVYIDGAKQKPKVQAGLRNRKWRCCGACSRQGLRSLKRRLMLPPCDTVEKCSNYPRENCNRGWGMTGTLVWCTK